MMIKTATRPRPASHPLPMGTPEPGVRAMLLYEILARARMREADEAARRHRTARQ